MVKRNGLLLHPNIAATVDQREDDGTLFFHFRGIRLSDVERIFNFLIGDGHGISSGANIMMKDDIVRRVGKSSSYISVEMISPNLTFCSISDMRLLIESVFRKNLSPAKFTWMSIDKFFNV